MLKKMKCNNCGTLMPMNSYNAQVVVRLLLLLTENKYHPKNVKKEPLSIIEIKVWNLLVIWCSELH